MGEAVSRLLVFEARTMIGNLRPSALGPDDFNASMSSLVESSQNRAGISSDLDLASMARQVAGGSVLMGGNRLEGALAGADQAGTPSKAEPGLTDRELEVLQLVAQGRPNSDIARELFITIKTGKFHLSRVFSKLGVRNRTEAATFALSYGLVSPQTSDVPGSPGR